jgi:hypothetical protein
MALSGNDLLRRTGRLLTQSRHQVSDFPMIAFIEGSERTDRPFFTKIFR